MFLNPLSRNPGIKSITGTEMQDVLFHEMIHFFFASDLTVLQGIHATYKSLTGEHFEYPLADLDHANIRTKENVSAIMEFVIQNPKCSIHFMTYCMQQGNSLDQDNFNKLLVHFHTIVQSMGSELEKAKITWEEPPISIDSNNFREIIAICESNTPNINTELNSFLGRLIAEKLAELPDFREYAQLSGCCISDNLATIDNELNAHIERIQTYLKDFHTRMLGGGARKYNSRRTNIM